MSVDRVAAHAGERVRRQLIAPRQDLEARVIAATGSSAGPPHSLATERSNYHLLPHTLKFRADTISLGKTKLFCFIGRDDYIIVRVIADRC